MSINTPPDSNSRDIAFSLLREDSRSGRFIEDRLSQAFESSSLDQRDKRFVQNLVYGCIRNLSLLDHIIDQSTNRKPPSGDTRVLLRLGIYQLVYMDRVADHAAINETVECARRAGFERQTGFINGMLRNILRGRESLSQQISSLATDSPWIRFSHPQWLFEKFSETYGHDNVIKWMRNNNEPAEVFLSPNGLLTDTQSLVRHLEKEECFVQLVLLEAFKNKKFIKWVSGKPPQTTEAFKSGLFYIQDPSTTLAPSCVRANAGDRILDMCAAPGGKTQLLVQQFNGGDVLIDAADKEQWRLDLINDNLKRLRMQNKVNVLLSDSIDHKYNWILVDAPCTNSGVLNRRVELRWRINEEEAYELSQTQSELLNDAASKLLPGGQIIYSTCTLDVDENENVIRKFQSSHPDFTLLQQSKICHWNSEVDGAFVACLKHSG